MAVLNIRTYPDSVLRENCASITQVTDEVRQLLDDMAETMYAAPGIGLAAPQIGRAVRVIVVDVEHDDEQSTQTKLLKLINPEIIAAEGTTETEEGCLSLPGLREYVTRSASITLKALDPQERELKIDATGLLAICLQHEIDHLNGVMIIDHLSRLKRELAKKKLLKFGEN